MTLLGRIFRILQASLPASDATPTGGQHTGRRSTVEDGPSPAGPPTVDQRLAGYYANLEIPYGSGLAEAKVAWRKMMKRYHPDLYSNDTERYKTATNLTQELTRAYKEIEKAHHSKKRL